MESIEYRVRAALWAPEQHYVLAGDALVLHETKLAGGKPAGEPITTRIPLTAITRLRLIYAPGRYETNRFQCEVIAQADGKRVKKNIGSFHFRGLADFVDQADTYTPFVRTLCQRTAQQNPALRLLAGYTPTAYYLSLILIVLVLAAFGAFLFIEWERIWRLPRTPTRLILLGSLLLIMLAMFRRNRPRTLQPNALPAELLPKVKE